MASVAVLAARALRERGDQLFAFTHVPRSNYRKSERNGRYSDETPYVDAIAKMNRNIDVTYVHDGLPIVFEDLDRISVALDGPVRNPVNLGWMLSVQKSARQKGCRVMLTGRHGNFAVSWDGWSQVARNFRTGHFQKAFMQWSLLYHNTTLSRWAAFRVLIVDPLLPHWLANNIRSARTFSGRAPWTMWSAINPDFGKSVGVTARAAAAGHDFYYRLRPDQRLMATVLEDFDGEWSKAMAAVTGVELRDPTTDVDVLSYCLGIPAEQYLVEGIDRSVIRRAMWGLLPEEVITNRTRGLQCAGWHETLSVCRRELAEQISVFAESPLISRMVDIDRLQTSIERWPSSGWDDPDTEREYRFVLMRGIAFARFLALFELQERSGRLRFAQRMQP